MVIDTKWKRISPRIEDAKHGINQGDVYQMMAYSQLYECDRVMLLYPYHQGLSGSLSQQTYAIGTAGASRKLLISTIDVSRRHSTVTASLSKLVMTK